MSGLLKSKFEDAFPEAIGHLTILAVAILGFQVLPAGLPRAVGVILLVVFAVLFALFPNQGAPAWKLHLFLALMAAIVAALIGIQPNWGVFPMLFFVLSPTAMMAFPQRTGMVWIGIFTLVTAIILFSLAPPWQAFSVWLPFSAGYWFFGAFARALGSAQEARQRSDQLLGELQTAHRQLQAYAARAEELAVAEERNRLAREMHDTLGHRLTVSAVQLEGAQKLISRDPERAANMVATVREQVREALAELRATVATLREPLAADLSLLVALQRMAASFGAATHLQIHLNLPETLPDLPGPHRLALYRAAQEALTNVQRHAQARQVWVRLESRPGEVSLRVWDDGLGFPPDARTTAFGLHGMRERATHLGGELHLTNLPEAGAQVEMILPLMKEENPNGEDTLIVSG